MSVTELSVAAIGTGSRHHPAYSWEVICWMNRVAQMRVKGQLFPSIASRRSLTAYCMLCIVDVACQYSFPLKGLASKAVKSSMLCTRQDCKVCLMCAEHASGTPGLRVREVS